MPHLTSTLLPTPERDYLPYLESMLARMRRLDESRAIHVNGFRLEF